MIGFNHAAVGGFIVKLLPLPLAIPVAFASHFLLDMLPHYGIPHERRDERFWRYFCTIDFIAAWTFLGYFGLARHHYAVLICGIVAASPDFIWVARVIRTRSFDLSAPRSKFAQWHAKIQHFERPWGIFVDVPVALVLGWLVVLAW